jgi:hypothetical protein
MNGDSKHADASSAADAKEDTASETNKDEAVAPKPKPKAKAPKPIQLHEAGLMLLGHADADTYMQGLTQKDRARAIQSMELGTQAVTALLHATFATVTQNRADMYSKWADGAKVPKLPSGLVLPKHKSARAAGTISAFTVFSNEVRPGLAADAKAREARGETVNVTDKGLAIKPISELWKALQDKAKAGDEAAKARIAGYHDKAKAQMEKREADAQAEKGVSAMDEDEDAADKEYVPKFQIVPSRAVIAFPESGAASGKKRVRIQTEGGDHGDAKAPTPKKTAHKSAAPAAKAKKAAESDGSVTMTVDQLNKLLASQGVAPVKAKTKPKAKPKPKPKAAASESEPEEEGQESEEEPKPKKKAKKSSDDDAGTKAKKKAPKHEVAGDDEDTEANEDD